MGGRRSMPALTLALVLGLAACGGGGDAGRSRSTTPDAGASCLAELEGVDAGTSDFIGVYTSVSAPVGCRPGQNPHVAQTPAAIMAWLRHSHAFTPFTPRPVTLGGLSGLAADLTVAPGWTHTCPWSGGVPVARTIVGVPPSDLDHNLLAGWAGQLYLLAYDGGALAVEAVDVHDAGHLAAYARVVESLRFG